LLVGYARVSTTDQTLDTQVERLTHEGCKRIFSEAYSGGSTEGRKQLQEALTFVREGDVLVCTKLDRLARSSVDLGIIANTLSEKGCDLVVLDQPIDTTSATGKLMFNMIAAFAEFERALIRERCQEGIERARARGVKFGRQAKLTDKQLIGLKLDFAAGELSKQAIAEKYGISRASVYRLAREESA